MSTLIQQPAIRIVVTASDPALRSIAQESADRFGLLYEDSNTEDLSRSYDYIVRYSDTGISLSPVNAIHGPVAVDFTTGKSAHRRQYGGGRKQPLARAVGLHKKEVVSIVDATAGFGADAFVIASLMSATPESTDPDVQPGITLVERSPALALMLTHAVRFASEHPDTAAVANRMRVIHADASACLPGMPDVDVIYLDPMYPGSSRTASAKKQMQSLQAIVGEDSDNEQLLTTALACARHRVVVKRPKSAPPLDGQMPQTSIRSPNTRYDVYLTSRG